MHRAQQLKLIDQVCDEFEESWRRGTRPDLAESLARVPEENRAEALADLLALELSFLKQQGETVGVADYEAAFPTYVHIIRRTFHDIYGDEETHSINDTIGADAPFDSPIPTAFDDYQLLGEVARGGMGVVYRAKQLSLERIVALKVILAGEVASDDAVERFISEAKAAAKLQHPGIVGIHEVGEVEGQHYFSMEFVTGKSLSDVVAEGGTSPQDAARYVRDAAIALQYAHDSGVLHRDVKPSNIMIDSAGRTRIMDFGLAKRVTGGSELTLDGQLLGTPGYMPPEQARGEMSRVDNRSDVYSLGAVLYAMLTGRAPHVAESPMATVMQVIERVPRRPSELVKSVDEELERICLRCLEREPDQRYQSGDELAAALDKYLAGCSSVLPPRPPRKTYWRWPMLAFATMGVVSAALVLVFTTGKATVRVELMQGVSKDVRVQLKKNGVVQIADAKNEWTVRVRAGRYEVSIVNSQDEFSLSDKTLTVERNGTKRLTVSVTRPKPKSRPQASQVKPSNLQPTAKIPLDPVRRFAAGEPLSPAALVRKPAHLKGVLSWTVELDGHRRAIRGMAFHPQHKKLATISSDSTIRIWNATAARVEAMMVSKSPPRTVAWSGDGRMLATECDDSRLRLWDIGRKRLVRVLPGVKNATAIAWSPREPTLASGSYAGSVTIRNLVTGKVESVLADHQGPVLDLAWSPQGRYLASTGMDKLGYVFDAKSWLRRHRLKRHTAPVTSIDWSSDASTLVTVSIDKSVCEWSNADGSMLGFHQIDRPGFRVRFLPDGKHLLVHFDDSSGVWLRNGEVKKRFQKGKSRFRRFLIADDGKTVAGTSLTGGVIFRDVLTAIERGSQGYTVTYGAPIFNRAMPSLKWEPKGKRIAFAHPNLPQRGARVGLWNLGRGPLVHLMQTPHFYVTSLDWEATSSKLVTSGSEPRVLLWEGDKQVRDLGVWGWTAVRFSPNGQMVAVRLQDGSIVINEVATGKKVNALRHSSPLPSLAWNPNSKQIATAGSDRIVKIWDALTGQVVKSIPTRRERVHHSLDWSGDDKYLAGGGFGTVFVWDKSHSPIPIAGIHKGWVCSVRFSPDAKMLASCDQAGKVRIWRVNAFDKVQELTSPRPGLRSLTWSPDSRFVAASCDAGSFLLWEVATGNRVGEYLAAGSHGGIGVAPNGHMRVSKGLADRVIYVVQTSAGQLNLTEGEFAKRFGWQNRPEDLSVRAN